MMWHELVSGGDAGHQSQVSTGFLWVFSLPAAPTTPRGLVLVTRDSFRVIMCHTGWFHKDLGRASRASHPGNARNRRLGRALLNENLAGATCSN